MSKFGIKVSVITVCFNSGDTIERTINSVLSQSYENLEYIIIDGGSNDNTLDVIERYKRVDDRIKLVSEKDDGIYDAMNKGIKLSTGNLVGIVNSDDYYEKDAIEQIVSKMDDSKYQILYGFERCIENGQEKRIVLYRHEFLNEQMITHPTCFVTNAIYKDFGMFDTNYKSSADYEFMLRLYENKDIKFTPVYHLISNFTLGGMSSSTKGYLETAKLKRKYGFISKGRYIYMLLQSVIHDLKSIL